MTLNGHFTLNFHYYEHSKDPKLINHVIIFELTQLIRPRYIHVTESTRTDRQTDRRKDDLLQQ